MSLNLRVPMAFVQSAVVPQRCFVTGEETPVSATALPMCTFRRRSTFPEIPYEISMPVSERGRARWEQIRPKPIRRMIVTAVVTVPLMIGAVAMSDIPEVMGGMIAAAVSFSLGQVFYSQYQLSTVAKVWWENAPDQLRLEFPNGQREAHAAWQAALEAWNKTRA